LPVRLLGIRRISIVIVLLLAYGYFKSVGANYSLVSIGLISFTAVAQFAPTVLAGLYWKRASKAGAFTGLILGFLIWAYTLPLPTLVEAGYLSTQLLEEGLFGLSWLRPNALFGMEGIDQVSHAAFWSLTFNTLGLVIVSLYSRPSALELSQADLFVDIYKYRHGGSDFEVMRRRARVRDIQLLLRRFLGAARADFLLRRFEQRYHFDLNQERMAGPELVNYAETHLAGAIGTASAKVIISSVAKEDPISLEEMFKILEQTQEIMQYSRALERKSAELEQTTQQLRTANEQLQELDRLKADFITTVTHELRTPITSIKALARILQDNRQLPEERQVEFLGIIVSESERIGRLINQVLDLEKSQHQDNDQLMPPVDLKTLVSEVVHKLAQLMEEKEIAYAQALPPEPVLVLGHHDRLTQVVVNLLSNAIKFCPADKGRIRIELTVQDQQARLAITDNGPGIPSAQQRIIFDQFTQVSDSQRGKPEGSGLGLYITRQIVRQHQGEINLASVPGQGATFVVQLPLAANG
jgi:signal transduction histidine kinase